MTLAPMTLAPLTRRGVLAGAGALVLSFRIPAAVLAQEGEVQGTAAPSAKLPGSLPQQPYLDAWIRIDASGAVSVFTGKAELGQGLKTAILQIAAEELVVDPKSITLVTADTARTANEGYTAGSQSMQNSGTAVRHAAAQVRELMLAQAARRLNVAAAELRAEAGRVQTRDGRALSYGELVSDQMLHINAQPQSRLTPTEEFRHMGKAMARIDIPAKVTGGEAYVQDLKLPGMLHARVVRPPRPGTRLEWFDAKEIEHMPGVVRVVRDGDFLAVVARREWQAIKAMRALAAAVRWSDGASLPKPAELHRTLEGLVSETGTVADEGSSEPTGGQTIEATYTRPYQIHGSIGPSCAVAKLDGDNLTVWTHTQGVYPDRNAIAQMLQMRPEQVRCIHVEGSGCYGHNGADDAAADAALIARAMPGAAIRLQWTREQEHAWEPYGPAMIGRSRATLNDGRITGWTYEVWSNTHSTRPGPAGALIAARHLAQPSQQPEAKMEITPAGNGDRNAVPLYDVPRKRALWHFIKDMPLRVSALRGLGAYLNVFAIESFVDELAAAASADPVEFRLRHLKDARARDVVSLAAERFGWSGSGQALPRRGRGFAFARYKNLAAYCAIAMEVEVERLTGRARVVRAVAAVDSGEIVNPDGIRNQIEGGILQSLSWTLYESVYFDETGIKSVDWASYPILRFNAVPDTVEVHIVPRPGQPFLGTGEAAQGPAAAAIANAIASATGHRLRDLPLTREKVRAAFRA